MEGIIIKNIRCNENRLDIDFSVSKGLEKYFAPEHHFFAEYTCDISNVPASILVVPLLSNLLQFSWLVDCIVWVNEIDKTFYDAIPNIKRGFQEMYPDFPFRGSLIPAKVVENSYTPQKPAIALFTGGIDATTTFLRIMDQKPILLNANGWYKTDIVEDKVYTADRNAIEKVAQNHGVETCFVRSNFATFIHAKQIDKRFSGKSGSTWWFGFQHSLAFLGCATVVAYKHKVEKMYIASSYTFGQEVKCVSDPRIDNYFAAASARTIHDGYELGRQDKVRYILKKQLETGKDISLRVCSFNTHNCCMCEKCFRSMLAIIAEGGDVSKFGFELPDTLLNCLKEFLKTQIMELDPVHILFWFQIMDRMEENYDNLKEREVYHFLKTFDFKRARRTYLWNYYRKNFFKILKRKLRIGTGK